MMLVIVNMLSTNSLTVDVDICQVDSNISVGDINFISQLKFFSIQNCDVHVHTIYVAQTCMREIFCIRKFTMSNMCKTQ